MEKIVSLCKRRGFIYPGSEIYPLTITRSAFARYNSKAPRLVRGFTAAHHRFQ